MAFTVGKYGLRTLLDLGQLVASVYIVSILFVVIVLGGFLRLSGFGIVRVLNYFKDEILFVFAATSAETMMPRSMRKLEKLGVSREVVGLVMPGGFSLNMDGTAIYMTMSVLFLAHAFNVHLTIWHQLSVLFVMPTATAELRGRICRDRRWFGRGDRSHRLSGLVIFRAGVSALVSVLVHGLGFANVLAELGLPAGAHAVVLVSFNLGVEAGQLAIVSVILPVAYLCRHWRFYPGFVLGAGSCGIVAVASVWLVERSLNVSFSALFRFAHVPGPAFGG